MFLNFGDVNSTKSCLSAMVHGNIYRLKKNMMFFLDILNVYCFRMVLYMVIRTKKKLLENSSFTKLKAMSIPFFFFFFNMTNIQNLNILHVEFPSLSTLLGKPFKLQRGPSFAFKSDLILCDIDSTSCCTHYPWIYNDMITAHNCCKFVD